MYLYTHSLLTLSVINSQSRSHLITPFFFVMPPSKLRMHTTSNENLPAEWKLVRFSTSPRVYELTTIIEIHNWIFDSSAAYNT